VVANVQASYFGNLQKAKSNEEKVGEEMARFFTEVSLTNLLWYWDLGTK
jgi:hypothetical protein